MASTDVSTFPVKGQAYRVTGKIVNGTTGNPITGGLTTLTSTVSKDGAAFASTTSAAAEIGTTGYFTVDLSATEMDAYTVVVHVTAANANAVYSSICLIPVVLDESSTHWMKQTVKRLEQGIMQMASWFVNKTKRNNTTGTITVRNVADSADVTTLGVNETSGEEVKASWS
jgi:hypothetical protein